jgi:hypothetical protein
LPLGSAAPVGCHPIAFEHVFASCGERPTEPDQRHSVGRRSARPGNADSRAPTSRPACRPTTSPRRSRDRGAGSRQRVHAAVRTTRHPAFRPLRAFESSSPTSSTSAGTRVGAAVDRDRLWPAVR